MGTVTACKYLLDAGRFWLHVDCDIFQGVKQLGLRKWAPLRVDQKSIDTVILTDAHIEHSGYLPLLVRNGFSNHYPALPLYTQRDAEVCLKQFAPVWFSDVHKLRGGTTVRFMPVGHILGAAIVEIIVGALTIVTSGGPGRPGSATMLDPTPVRRADYPMVVSTYDDRRHDPHDPEEALVEVVNRTTVRGRTVLIPAFAVGRTQMLLFHLERLKIAKRVPNLPVFVDSPMAINTGEIFCEHVGEHRLTAQQCRRTCGVARYVRQVEESKALDRNSMLKVIVSASGIATGGRILHHLRHYARSPAILSCWPGSRRLALVGPQWRQAQKALRSTASTFRSGPRSLLCLCSLRTRTRTSRCPAFDSLRLRRG